jgi:hypothetical protein
MTQHPETSRDTDMTATYIRVVVVEVVIVLLLWVLGRAF